MKSTLFAFLSLFIPLSGMACSCQYVTNFCETLTDTTTVVAVEVIQTYLVEGDWDTVQYIDVLVIEELKGSAPDEILSFQVGDQTSCPPYIDLSAYSFRDTLIVMLNRFSGFNADGVHTYRPDFSCSQELMRVSGANKYDTFKEDLEQCVLFTKTYDVDKLHKILQLYPNPGAHTMRLNKVVPMALTMTVFKSNGQFVMQEYISNGELFEKDITEWANGLYYVRLEVGNQVVVKKFVKVEI